MIEIGNELVISIEDIIHHVANYFGNWGTNGPGKRKGLDEQIVIRKKCLNLRLLFNSFQSQIKSEVIYSTNGENAVFRIIDEYDIDDLITEFMIGNDVNKLIDEAHDICNKLRRLLLYLEFNRVI